MGVNSGGGGGGRSPPPEFSLFCTKKEGGLFLGLVFPLLTPTGNFSADALAPNPNTSD